MRVFCRVTPRMPISARSSSSSLLTRSYSAWLSRFCESSCFERASWEARSFFLTSRRRRSAPRSEESRLNSSAPFLTRAPSSTWTLVKRREISLTTLMDSFAASVPTVGTVTLTVFGLTTCPRAKSGAPAAPPRALAEPAVGSGLVAGAWLHPYAANTAQASTLRKPAEVTTAAGSLIAPGAAERHLPDARHPCVCANFSALRAPAQGWQRRASAMNAGKMGIVADEVGARGFRVLLL